MMRYIKRIQTYFGKHPQYNSVTHVLVGIGVGFLLAYPLAGAHPVRWGAAFLIVSVFLHYWAATNK